MKLHFNTPDFDLQLLRVLGTACYGGADFGECLACAHRIKEGDFESWHEEFSALAKEKQEDAEDSLNQGLIVSASENFLRASIYFKTAYAFLLGLNETTLLKESYERHRSCFNKAARLFVYPPEEVELSLKDGVLNGHFYPYDAKTDKKPTLIVVPGYEQTKEEAYFFIAAAARRRGYNVFTFDRPKNGSCFIDHACRIPENPTPWYEVIEGYLKKRHDVRTDRIVLYGIGFGGFLAQKMAASHQTIHALITNPGQIEALKLLKKSFPEAADHLEKGDAKAISTLVSQAMTNKQQELKFKLKMWAHKAETALDLIKELQKFSLDEEIKKIQCPTLVVDSESEVLCHGQAKELFDKLQCKKKYTLFTNKEGAGAHHQAGALLALHRVVFDWLDRVVHAPETLDALTEYEANQKKEEPVGTIA